MFFLRVMLLLGTVSRTSLQCTTPGCSTANEATAGVEQLRHLVEQQTKLIINLQERVDTLPTDCECNRVYRDCMDLMNGGFPDSGVYFISVNGLANSVPVYCDMETDGGGWLVFQKRQDGSVNFNRTWAEYANGFGDASGEVWIGNRILHLLTSTKPHELRVELNHKDTGWKYASYQTFSVASERENFQLEVGTFSGDVADALAVHNGSPFSAYNRDLDSNDINCAQTFGGGWWFVNCGRCHLNTPYAYLMDPNKAAWTKSTDTTSSGDRAITHTNMMIRPL